MKREDGIPIGAAKESAGAKGGGLNELIFGDFELEPGFARHFHFGSEDEAGGFTGGIGEDDAPEVEGVAREEFGGVTAAAADAGAAEDAVHPAAEFPGPVHGGPAFGSAEGPDGGEGAFSSGGEGDGLLVGEDTVSGDLHGLEEFGWEITGGEGVEPRRRDSILGNTDEGSFDRLLVGEEFLEDEGVYAGIAADGLVGERLDEGFGERIAGGGDEVEPAGGEAGSEERDGDDEALKIAGFGVSEEEIAVGEDVGSSDVEFFAEGFFFTKNAGEVSDDVTDGDGLAAVGGPLRGDHEGELLGEVPDNFEGGGAGAHDDGGAEGGDGDGAVSEDAVDVLAGGEVGGKIAFGDESAEVDDLATLDPVGEAGGAGGFAFFEIAAGTHGVEEVVGGVEVIGNGREVAEEIAFEEGELVVVEEGLELGRGEAGDGADDTSDAVAGFEEGGEEAHADVAVGAGEEDVHGKEVNVERRVMNFECLVGRWNRGFPEIL